jgi:hypothetical protein
VGSRVLVRQSSDNLRRSYLKDAVGTPARAMFDDAANAGSSMMFRSATDPSLEINYVDDPRLAVGETFARATIGTTVDFEGRVLTCLSGEARFYGMRRVANLLRVSQDFTSATWLKSKIAVQGSDAVSQTKRPADRIVEDATSGQHYIEQTGINVPQGGTACAWAIVKPGTRTRFYVAVVQRDAATVLGAMFDLSAGTVTAQEVGVTGFIYPAGDGLFKCVAVVSAGTGATAIRARFQMLDASSAKVYQGDGAGYVWLREAQCEDISGQSWQGASEYVNVDVMSAPYHGANVDGVRYFVTDYQGKKIDRYTSSTYNTPRKGLLCEPASTNPALQSADFTSASWVAGAVTIGGSVTLPDGTTGTKNKIQEDNTTAIHQSTQAVTKAASAITYTFSVYLKAGERTRARVILSNNAQTNYAATFVDLSAGTLDNTVTTTFTSSSFSIVACPNGWWRVIITATSDTDTIIKPGVLTIASGTTTSFAGTTGSGIYVWGAQLEQLDHATSYIPTTTVAVTRNADVDTLLASAGGVWLNSAAAMTVVSKAATTNPVAGSLASAVVVSNGTGNFRLGQFHNSLGTRDTECSIVDGGAFQATFHQSTPAAGVYSTLALAAAANDFAGSADGGAVATDTAGTVPVVDRLCIGHSNGGTQLGGFVARVWVYPFRLANGPLAAAMSGI